MFVLGKSHRCSFDVHQTRSSVKPIPAVPIHPSNAMQMQFGRFERSYRPHRFGAPMSENTNECPVYPPTQSVANLRFPISPP